MPASCSVPLPTGKKQPDKSNSCLFPGLLFYKKKVIVFALWYFRAESGQRMESGCLLQLLAKGGHWIQSLVPLRAP